MKKCELIVVFDAYRVSGHHEEYMDYHNIHVVYTKEAETADHYIEKFAHENGKKYNITVVAIKRKGEMFVNPHPDMKMDVEDMLVILGDSESVKRVTATLGQ